MSSTNLKYLGSLRSILHTPAIKQLVFLLGISAGVTVGFFLYTSIQDPLYRPLDYQINQQNMASIVDTLDKAGIHYKINEQDGVIYVAADDVQAAKIKLSAAGIAKDDSFNFSYLNDQATIGNSQFLENARYLRALESDLSKTISAIEGVSHARVHIAIPQNNVFADENQKPTASVVVNMAPGLSSDKEKVRAIVQIVASSVPGLDPKEVAITDQYGHFLSGSLDQESVYSAQQLTYQNSIQNYYEKRVGSLITPLLGDNKVNVRVFANIDFTQQEETQEAFDPDQKVIRSEQTMSEQSSTGGASGPAGALANSPPEGDSEKGATGQGGSDGKSESIKNYEVGKSVRYKKSTQPKLMNLSVAVVVDNDVIMDPKTHKMVSKPITTEKIKQITDLVKATIGFDEKRGDKVTVINSSFNAVPTQESIVSIPLWNQPWFWDMMKKILGIAGGFIFLFILYKKLIHFMKTDAPMVNVKAIAVRDDNEAYDSGHPTALNTKKQEQIYRLKELATRDPDRVALIIKNWVGK